MDYAFWFEIFKYLNDSGIIRDIALFEKNIPNNRILS